MSKTLKQLQEEHRKAVGDMKAIQERNTGKKEWDAEDAATFRTMAAEVKGLQTHLDAALAVQDAESWGNLVDRVSLPASAAGEQKSRAGSPDDVVGYVSMGEAFTASEAYRGFAAQGMPAGHQAIAQFDTATGGRKSHRGFVPVTRKMLESKAIPTIGAGVIPVDRDPDVVRFAERRPATIRDVLNVSNTTSNSIEYTVISSFTNSAAPVAEGAVKPEAALAMASATAPVRTLAHWIPVTEQQLADVPQLQNTIDVEMRWGLQMVEEQQLVWGDGLGQNLLGILNTPGVVAGRSVTDDTIIDLARRAMTDVALASLQPNAVLMHPIDWETAQLTKATDGMYVWAIVTNDNGSRIWGARVIETMAMQAPGTTERRMVVGDFLRGATLWDRQQAAVQVGWKNDDFIRNLRTLRAEERLAFGVKRPAAFRYRITQAAA